MAAVRATGRAARRLLAGVSAGVRRACETLAGGWHDVRSVAARITAPVRDRAATAGAAVREARRRLRTQVREVRVALRRR